MCTGTEQRHLDDALADLEAVSGLRDFRLRLAEIGSLVSAGQGRLARAERASALGLPEPPGTNFRRDFAIVRRQTQQAREGLRGTLRSENWAAIQRAVDTAGPVFAERLEEVRGMWVDGLLEMDAPAVAATEVLGIIDRVAEVTRNHGVGGLGSFIEEQLGELDRVLVADRDWGREPHSPLEWWEWVLIAALIGAFVFAVLACFWWSDCSWVRAALAAVCAVVEVIDGLAWFAPTCRTLLRSIS